MLNERLHEARGSDANPDVTYDFRLSIERWTNTAGLGLIMGFSDSNKNIE